MGKHTILEAVVEVLTATGGALSSQDIYAQIIAGKLFQFSASEPVGMVRAAIRKHLRTHGGAGQPRARVREVARDSFTLC